MNKTAIKNYAIWARVQLIESAKQRAYEYEITENGENNPNLDSVGGRLLSKVEKEQRIQLINQIRQKGYTQVMEEAAYTWFNRFIALRFMEVNGYLPSKVRVFTDESGAFKPEILKEAMSVDLPGVDRQLVLELLEKQNNEELYKYLLIAQCNALNTSLPCMFERISNWTELLFPIALLRQDSIIGSMISNIPEEDWTDAVQIIGWMYQFYITELNEMVYDGSFSKTKIAKELIPAATTIYTPDWPIRYMVENSLGRLWYEAHEDFDKSQWKYYLDETTQNPEVAQQLKAIREEYTKIRLEEIKVIDPCMGSGHILVYAFEVLMQIYTSAGWAERDAALSILKHNLYGLDIDDRAGQLAYFAIMMKARKYNRRILNGDVKPNVLSIQESNWMTDDFITFIANKDNSMKTDLVLLRTVFNDAKEYGSILNVPSLDYNAICERIDTISKDYIVDLFEVQYRQMAIEQLWPLIKQAQIMSQKYNVVVTNPPYLSSSRYSTHLEKYIKKVYPDVKSDLSMVMLKHTIDSLIKNNGYISFIATTSWMFLPSFEKLRTYLQKQSTITSLVDYGTELFDGKVGHNHIASWVLRKGHINYTFPAIRLVDFCFARSWEKESQFFNIKNRYFATYDKFTYIPNSPIAYWIGDGLYNAFKNGKPLSVFANSKIGVQTGNNDLFVRFWFEVDIHNTPISDETIHSKWYPYTKGGKYRKWYGNNEMLINWENNGAVLKKYNGFGSINTSNWFKPCVTWGLITFGSPNFRYIDDNLHVIGNAGPSFVSQQYDLYLLALVNSKIIDKISSLLNPTMNLSSGIVDEYPVIIEEKAEVEKIAIENIEISKKDWDSFETSWNYQVHPMIPDSEQEKYTSHFITEEQQRRKHSFLISEQFYCWQETCEQRFRQLKVNEEKLNHIFIDIYNMQDEMTIDVEDKDVSVQKADLSRDIRSLISYAVGCILGRYSLDKPGLAFAGGKWNPEVYKKYPADKDGILPITDDEYFEDDIVGMFVNWVCTVYGEETLEANLKFIADALGGKGTPREIIRQYFLNDFYNDHLKIYQRRPIYWLFTSGKKNSFKCLIYIHRYQPDLLARIRTDYVHEQQERYRTQLTMLEDSLQTARASERVKLNKRIAKLKDQALELQKYEEKIHHLADQMIPIDLDDGVKVNYAKFQDVLEKIK